MNDKEENNIYGLKKWAYWYWFVILFELALIAAFYFLTKYYS